MVRGQRSVGGQSACLQNLYPTSDFRFSECRLLTSDLRLPDPHSYIPLKKHILYITLILFLLLSVFMFRQAGNWLVRTDVPQKADAILILMGSRGDRALEAAALWEKHFADTLIFVEDYENGREFLTQRGIVLPNDAYMTSSILNQLGVPESCILTLPGEAKSTLDEADALKKYLVNKPSVDTLILVTSKSHSRRAIEIFDKSLQTLPHKVILISCPSSYDNFQAKTWWKHRETAKQVFLEYLKIISFVIFEQW